MLASLGTTYRDGGGDLIARLSAGGDDTEQIVARLRDRVGAVALLSTCNRYEVYTSADVDSVALLRALSTVTDVPAEALRQQLQFRAGPDASRHLYEVASGLDSMSLGEHEILGQIRTAWCTALDVRADDPVLAHLFHGAMRTGRRVRSETSIGRNAASIPALAAAEAAELVPDLDQATVLIVGAGEAGRSAALAMHARGVPRILVTNRSPERAQALAGCVAGEAIPFSDLASGLREANVAVSGTASPGYVLDRPVVQRALDGAEDTDLVLIDIAMPRDVDPAVKELPGVRYRSVEDLQSVAARDGSDRALEVPRARAIVAEEHAKLIEWWECRDSVPTIAALTAHAERIRRAQVAKTARRMELTEDDRTQLELMTRSIVKQLLHQPISAMRASPAHEDATASVRRLFELDTGVPVS